jgi:hypothetical protein
MILKFTSSNAPPDVPAVVRCLRPLWLRSTALLHSSTSLVTMFSSSVDFRSSASSASRLRPRRCSSVPALVGSLPLPLPFTWTGASPRRSRLRAVYRACHLSTTGTIWGSYTSYRPMVIRWNTHQQGSGTNLLESIGSGTTPDNCNHIYCSYGCGHRMTA